ncbi:hypothetical protein HD553DRAFT_302594 [Filobasidium floriforme]|uniref:uncharacterized protein n=1 Tax=Filobasidium floriforme TaxID=5210 RepID=UPI001E8E7861|nr:uncharacterized protein HD553DRAFT_302594 [Filobasidium floriforme]KAH8090510.1 hypothetical protein HD553DRAFT_302594 [Filobasidium floriforme]
MSFQSRSRSLMTSSAVLSSVISLAPLTFGTYESVSMPCTNRSVITRRRRTDPIHCIKGGQSSGITRTRCCG